MQDGGAAVVSLAKASGEKRIFKAMSAALNSPLVSNMNKRKIRRLLYIVYSGDKAPAMMSELQEINEFMEGMNENVEVLWGHYHDSTLEDEIKVSLIATWFDPDEVEGDVRSDAGQRYKKLYDKYYNGDDAVKNVLPKPGDDDGNVNVSKGGGDDSKEPNFLHVLIQKLKDFTEE
jgi:cell division protein FtsZ